MGLTSVLNLEYVVSPINFKRKETSARLPSSVDGLPSECKFVDDAASVIFILSICYRYHVGILVGDCLIFLYNLLKQTKSWDRLFLHLGWLRRP